MLRRNLLRLTAAAIAVPAVIKRVYEGSSDPLQTAVDRFAALPGTTGALAVVEHPTAPLRIEHEPQTRLFVGSAVKTFILAQFLREVEAGRLSEDRQMTIDDTVRSLSSPVFGHLTGTTPARSVLEAMIAHSDNTATDVALAAVTPARVRALIAEAGLNNTQIADSTRRMFSYLAGTPDDRDLGWEAMKRIGKGEPVRNPRTPMNDRQTMSSTAEDLVRWYQLALRGVFFKKPETLVEFKRIQATADAIAQAVPADTVAFAKGGSIDWQDFHCLCFAGQMVVNKTPVTFCLALNWTGPDEGVAAMTSSYRTAAAEVLRDAAATIG